MPCYLDLYKITKKKKQTYKCALFKCIITIDGKHTLCSEEDRRRISVNEV